MHVSQLAPRGYAQVRPDETPPEDLWVPARSKGVIGVVRKVPSNSSPVDKKSVYCFDLTFTPDTAVSSAFFNNNAVVAMATAEDMSFAGCPAPYNDAAARTYAANGDNGEIGFGIAFM